MEFLEYHQTIDKNDDDQFIFKPIGNIEPTYLTRISIDYLNADENDNGLICKSDCNCKDHLIRKRKCKHLIKAIEVLLKRGNKIREEPLKRYFCTLCKIGIDSIDYSLGCPHCGKELVLPKEKDSSNLNNTKVVNNG